MDMPKLQCVKCNFEFKKEQIPIRCPYCAAEETIMPYRTAKDYLSDRDI